DFHMTGVQTCALPTSELEHALERSRLLGVRLGCGGEAAVRLCWLRHHVHVRKPTACERAEQKSAPDPVQRGVRDAERALVARFEIGRASCRESVATEV